MQDSMYAVVRMATKGFPLGADKCAFLSHEPVVLGLEIDGPQRKFRVGSKALKQLLGIGLPHMHKELLGLMKKMNFCW